MNGRNNYLFISMMIERKEKKKNGNKSEKYWLGDETKVHKKAASLWILDGTWLFINTRNNCDEIKRSASSAAYFFSQLMGFLLLWSRIEKEKGFKERKKNG